MATTQAQRASLFNMLAELMGEEDAETLMQQLPPGGWDSMATKDDLQAFAGTLTASFTAAHAEFRAEFTNALAEFRVDVTNALAEFRVEFTNALAEAAKERAEIVKSQAEMVKSQARNLYITVSTIVLAAVSIWIALLAGPTGG